MSRDSFDASGGISMLGHDGHDTLVNMNIDIQVMEKEDCETWIGL